MARLLTLECAPTFQALTDGKEKYVWLVASGQGQLFDLENDPQELRDLAKGKSRRSTLEAWRKHLINELEGRPEGFTDGERPIAGRPYTAALPYAGKSS